MDIEYMRKPVHYLKTNPKGWIRASLPTFKASVKEVISQTPVTMKELKDIAWSQRHDYLHFYTLKVQQRRWEEEVGIKPEDSHFTLIVPIYNEEKSLPSFLRTLLLSDIPSSVHANIVFITNVCNDSSSALIDEFLSTVGFIKIEVFNVGFTDKNVNPYYKSINLGSISFMHIDTGT